MTKKKVIQESKGKSLTEVELWKLRALEAEVKCTIIQTELLLLKKKLYLDKIDPDGKLASFDRDIRSLSTEQTERKCRGQEIKKLAEERLGIDLSKYSYDEENGTVFPHGEEQ